MIGQVALLLLISPLGDPQAGEVEVRIDGARTHQVLEGFGATTLSLVHPGTLDDPLGAPLRGQALEALYRQVKITMGNIAVGPPEGPPGRRPSRNDNDDPRTIDWSGFGTAPAEAMWKSLVEPAAAMGFDDYSLEGKINWRWLSPWLSDLHRKDRDRCLEECAEQAEACVRAWKKIAGVVPRYVHLFNEPTSGNREIEGADAAMVRDIVQRAGRRLRTAGFPEVKFVVPNEETVARTVEVARVILEDPEARQYVAAVGYHVYPYGSPYASVPRILEASGAGRPDPESVRQRGELRDLCRRYGVPAWMTEVSHGEVDPRSFDHLRGRAIHIHDEMVHADAGAFYGMNAMWDQKTHAAHFAGRGGEDPEGYLTEQDTIVLVANEARKVLITGMGYAIGHYARWLERGAVRLEVESPDPLLLVTAFRDPRRRLVLVMINNATEERRLKVVLSGIRVTGSVNGEESSETVRWHALEPLATESPSRFGTRVPGKSVTTYSVGLAPSS